MKLFLVYSIAVLATVTFLGTLTTQLHHQNKELRRQLKEKSSQLANCPSIGDAAKVEFCADLIFSDMLVLPRTKHNLCDK